MSVRAAGCSRSRRWGRGASWSWSECVCLCESTWGRGASVPLARTHKTQHRAPQGHAKQPSKDSRHRCLHATFISVKPLITHTCVAYRKGTCPCATRDTLQHSQKIYWHMPTYLHNWMLLRETRRCMSSKMKVWESFYSFCVQREKSFALSYNPLSVHVLTYSEC